MSNASKAALLSARSCCVLTFLAEIAAAGGETPTNEQIGEMLIAAGFSLGRRTGKKRFDLVAYELARLIKARRLTAVGVQRYRVFEVVDLGLRTKPRAAPTRSRAAYVQRVRSQGGADREGWPWPTAESAASYDRAVRRREFGKAAHNTSERPDTFRKVGTPYGLRSLTGSAAAECAA